MARTYTLQSTAARGGGLEAWREGTWNDFSDRDQYRAGQLSGSRIYATYYMFDAATLASLASKPIVSVTLNITVVSGIIPRSTATYYPIGYKYTTVTGGTGSNTAWQRSNEAQTDKGTYTAGYVRTTTSSDQTANNTPISISLSTHVPKYGVVIGPGSGTQYDTAIFLASSATLTIVTNEYTINYNKGANGTGTNVTDIKTHGTALTLRGAIFSRTGYNQAGWSTSDGGSKAYNLSASYTANADATLYPYWQKITYQVSYNSNGGSGAPAAQTKEYGVNLTLSSTVPTRTNYIFQGWATSSSGAVAYQPGGTYTANAAVTLYAIWKLSASTLSSVTSTVNIGSSGTASWNILNSGYTYKLEITCGSAPTVTVNVAANTSSASFTIPTTWYSYFASATSGTATAKLSTYNGSTLVGTSTKTFTVAVASSVKPTISAFTVNPSSSNSTVNGWGVFVQGYSKANLSVTASAGTGAIITSIAFSGVGVSKNSLETTAESPVLTISGSTSYTVTVTDSRGRTATSTATRYINPYANPAISKLEAVRCLSDGTQSDTEGTYLKARQTFTYSAVDKNTTGGSITAKNSLSIKRVDYKRHDASSWTTGISSAVSGTSWSSVFGGGNIDIAYSYDVRLTVQDALGTLNAAVLTINVPPITGFHLGFKNDRARFGGVCEKAGLQIDWPMDITPRRCYATLSSAGWYRVLRYKAADSGDVMGGWGLVVDFNIQRVTSSENHSVTMRCVSGGNVSFVNESSKSFSQYITKIRYTYDSTNLIAYVDIYYNTSNANMTGVDFTVHGPAFRTQSAVTAESLQSVAASPSGETVAAEYSFSANTEADGSVVGASGFTPDEIDVKRSGRVVYVHFYVQNVSIAANTNTIIGALSGVPFPKKNIRWLAGGGAHAYDATTPVYAILGPSGNIAVTSPSAISAVNITISYIV